MTNPNLSQRQFWRVHPNDRPFSRADATSREWGSDDAPDPGYSSVTRPEHLFGYFNPSERDPHESHIIKFTGRQIGTGMDGEPLVMPSNDEPDAAISWRSARKLVGDRKVKAIDRRNGWRSR